MSSYEQFAEVYDRLMTDIPYDAYAKWVQHHAPSNEFPKLLDVGCGTGVLSSIFAKAGYSVVGLDLSEEMLTIAQERFANDQLTIPLVCQSMHELDGFQQYDVVTIAIDSLNYLEQEEDVKQTFENVYESLSNGGHLFFDVHSLYKMNHIFLDGPFTYEDDEITYIWHTEEGEDPHSVYHDLTFFVKMENGFYKRFFEQQFQRTFRIEQYEQWLSDIGFKEITITADWTEQAPTEDSTRIFFHAIK